MSAHQYGRLATESVEEREARLGLECPSTWTSHTLNRKGERDPLVPLLRQSSVQVKMRTFYAQFSTLTLLKCSIYFKSFPGLPLRPSSAECLHCSRDLCTLKLYTCANNMDPSKLPPQLQVSSILLNCCKMCIVIYCSI